METVELLEIISRGEDSRHQFKKNINNPDALAAEIVAFSNSDGGKIIIGVDDDGTISGLTLKDISRLNELLSSVASQNVRPAVNVSSENIKIDGALVMTISVSEGLNKPYQDKNGITWVKVGADKRKNISREEMQRMYRQSELIYADELPVKSATVADLDIPYFKDFFHKRYGKLIDEQPLSLTRIVENMGLLKDDSLTLAGTLLFAKEPQFKRPVFIVKAGAFDADDLTTDRYIDSRDITGKLGDVFLLTKGFILSNLRHIQGDQGVNSIGIPEIPAETIEELVANALIHRDYFISSPVRVFVFRNRVEIISPGHLPNKLTVEQIKSGLSNVRNHSLASFANHILPYRGYGAGILRALEHYSDIDFIDDRDGNQFKAILKRR